MTSSTWQNRFSTIFPPKNINFENHHRKEYICGSLKVQWRNASQLLEEKKNLRLNALKRGRGIVPLCPYHPSPKAGTAQCQKRPCRPMIFHMGESRTARTSTQLPYVCGNCQSGTFLSHPIQNTES